MAQIKIHNGGYYAHAQTSNAYITSVRVKILVNL